MTFPNNERTHAMSECDLVFVSRITHNLGDSRSCPKHYFPFGNYAHRDLMDPQGLPPGATVVLGGGGLFGHPYFAKAIDRLSEGAHRVVVWGAGHNTHTKDPDAPIAYPSFLARCLLVGLRDRDTGYEQVPCVSCMSPLFDRRYPVTRKLGLYAHSYERHVPHDWRLKAEGRWHNTSADFEGAIEFLGSCEMVVTDSYHGMYWAALLGRPVVVYPFSTKFRRTPFKVAFRAEDATEVAKTYDGLLAACRAANTAFYKRVCEHLAGGP
jgi:hypothetical protein